MKLNKTKELLILMTKPQWQSDPEDTLKALNLAVEAINFIQRSRFFGYFPINRLLPGETAEGDPANFFEPPYFFPPRNLEKHTKKTPSNKD